MGVFSSGGVGMDAGSANITICLENEGVVLREPSYVLTLREKSEEILAVGRDARQMLGRTPKDVALRQPIRCGAVADIPMTTALIATLADKALGRRRALDKNRFVIAASAGNTAVERAALEEAIHATGAKRAYAVYSCVAAAIGAGLPMDAAKGTLLVCIGGETTDICVLSMNGIVALRTVRTGGNAIDEAIMRFIRRDKNLIIGQRTAEDLKVDLGSAIRPEGDIETVTLRGRDARIGKPSTATITTLEIYLAIQPALENLLENIREAFENIPPEIAEDILPEGIFLSGGALLEGLDERLGQMLSLKVTVDDEPQDDAARGACIIASNDRLLQKLLQSGCVSEV